MKEEKENGAEGPRGRRQAYSVRAIVISLAFLNSVFNFGPMYVEWGAEGENSNQQLLYFRQKPNGRKQLIIITNNKNIY